LDHWATYNDVEATYVAPDATTPPHYDGGLTDTFTFQLRLPSSVARGARLEFSVRFVVGPDATFWDSNFGHNYAIDCIPLDRD